MMTGFSTVGLLYAMLAVGLGAFLGGALRGLLRHWPGGLRGTLTANLAACLVLGIALGAIMDPASAGGGFSTGQLWRLALGTGFSGALSTWSTLAGELGALLRDRCVTRLVGYLTATLGGGLGLVWLGAELGTLLR